MTALLPDQRRISPGKFLYHAWHKPRGAIAAANRQGWVNTWLSARGRVAMERAAADLPSLAAPEHDAPQIWFLTGNKFWYQTIFCAYSLQQSAESSFVFMILDDGTLTPDLCDVIRRVLTGCVIIDAHQIVARLDASMPASKFPILRARRIVYPHLRKLTDVHAGGCGWKLVLDSDMLFHSRSPTLMNWLESPTCPIHMRDIETAYGYSDSLLRELAGGAVPERVNVGVCGLRSDAIDWERLEHWCRVLMEREGSHYLQEQALTAMLVRDGHLELPLSESVVCPNEAQNMSPTASLHHYVAESKSWYFRYAWRSVASKSAGLRS